VAYALKQLLETPMLLLESQQNIMNLGYPKLIASIFHEAFGKKAFLIAKWFREYYSYKHKNKDWFKKTFDPVLVSGNDITLFDWIRLYESTFTSPEKYNAVRQELDLYIDPNDIITLEDLAENRKLIRQEIKDKFFYDVFFSFTLIKDILSGKLTDLKPYAKLPFQEAKDAYDKKRVFSDYKALKSYRNGWRWINVGRQCQLVGGMMRNCGSAGVMSTDPDRTLIVLFDKHNKAHVIITYSPNEKRISGDEGAASTAVKSKYHNYVLDLAKILGAKLDAHKTKSKGLKIKTILGDRLAKIKKINIKSMFAEFFDVTLEDGRRFVTNGFDMVPVEMVDAATAKESSRNKAIKVIFSKLNTWKKPDGVIRLETMTNEAKYSVLRWQQLAGILKEGKKAWDEVQSDLFRGSGVNASTDFDKKIPEFASYMSNNGWSRMPPIHGVIQTVDEQDIEDYQEAEENGYEHELDWSRPLTKDDLGMVYVNIEDGHSRAWAAKEAGIPIRVKRWK